MEGRLYNMLDNKFFVIFGVSGLLAIFLSVRFLNNDIITSIISIVVIGGLLIMRIRNRNKRNE